MSFSRVKIPRNIPRFPRSRKVAAADAAAAAAAAPATITSRANYGGDQDAKLSRPHENYGRGPEKIILKGGSVWPNSYPGSPP